MLLGQHFTQQPNQQTRG